MGLAIPIRSGEQEADHQIRRGVLPALPSGLVARKKEHPSCTDMPEKRNCRPSDTSAMYYGNRLLLG